MVLQITPPKLSPYIAATRPSCANLQFPPLLPTAEIIHPYTELNKCHHNPTNSWTPKEVIPATDPQYANYSQTRTEYMHCLLLWTQRNSNKYPGLLIWTQMYWLLLWTQRISNKPPLNPGRPMSTVCYGPNGAYKKTHPLHHLLAVSPSHPSPEFSFTP